MSDCVTRPPGMPVSDIRQYLIAGGDAAEEADALMRAHGVATGGADWEQQTVPVDVCWRIFSAHAAKVDDETHGLFGERLKLGTTTLIVARMALSSTVLDALLAYKEASALMLPGLEVSVVRREGVVSLKWRSPGDSIAHWIALEGQAIVYHAILSWLVGERLTVERVRAPVQRKLCASTLLAALEAPVSYSGADLEIVFSASTVELPIVPRDIRGWQDGAYHILCSAVSNCQSARHEGAFTRKVRSAMLRDVDQRSLAEEWGVSTKTIARRLEQEGCSFRRVRDEVRMQKSTPLIHAGLSIELISDMLGYEDPRSFRRAFKRWFGVSPSAFRDQTGRAR